MRCVSLAPGLLLAGLTPPAYAQNPPPADWRDGGVCYEVFVRSFYDSDGDGVGDLPGLIQKLDYISDGDPQTLNDLGASCIWLMPIAQSPSYHGYDVTNYYHVDREYGTNEDFKRLIAEAHRRGIAIIVDLVLNHSSNEHPFFKSALLDPASPYRDWYVWSPTVRASPGWQAPVWHRAPDRDEYYYGLFWHGMPDINLASADATAELKNVARYWLEEMGVDGFRLDAVRHLFEGADGSWKNRPETNAWLRDYAAFIRQVAPDAYTVGEVWDSTEVLLSYYPDQLESYFMFEIADAILDAVRTGSATGLIASVERAQRELPRGRYATFLRNHDQTRTMTELRGDDARAKLAATLLLTLPGLPFVYYGEEIGMQANKPDPRLRTPMHWTREPAVGFTSGTPWEPLQPDSFTANVQAQDADPASLLNHHRRLIHLRDANPALGSGDFVPLTTSAPGVLAYLRRAGEHVTLVVANLGDRPATGVALTSPRRALEAGRYRARGLLGDADFSDALRIPRDGRIDGWAPIGTLAPQEARVLQLSRH